jgi:nucleotide-binding universal stress UspA family protein
MTSRFARILVPTDFSGAADVALEYARTLAERFGGSIHLLHVIEDPLGPAGIVSETSEVDPADLRTALLKAAQHSLASRVHPKDRATIRVATSLIGTAARTIVHYAAENGIDLIVMGTHGRTGLAHAVMGSVAEKVVRTAPCPVLTVRAEATPEAHAAVETLEV